MLRDITLGQYYPTGSVIHKLDPRTKLIGTVAFIVSLFLFKNWPGYLAATAFLAVVIRISRVPFRYMIKGLKAIIILLVLTVVFNLFIIPGEVLWDFGIVKITKEGLSQAGFMALRLVYLIIGSSVMTLTTTPNDLTDGLERVLGPLKLIRIRIGRKVFRVPVHEISMMMSIALRFIPILLEETDKIMKAQMARGADFENGNLIQKARNMVPLLVPLFVSAFRRAGDLAMAMEARCYRGDEGRTKMKPLLYEKRDFIAYGILAAYLAAVTAIGMLLR